MPDLCPLHALLLQGARPALWGWSGRPGRGSRSGTEHSLATGRVHQQGDEGGGGRADAVQGQHGVLALLLAYHVVCGDCRVSACHPCCLWYPLHSTHVFLNVSRLSCSVPPEAWASSSYSAGVQHLGELHVESQRCSRVSGATPVLSRWALTCSPGAHHGLWP